jgi:hypothetical protein
MRAENAASNQGIRLEALRRLHPLALERFCERARIFDDLKRSNGLTMLTQMRARGLLTHEKCFSLSAEARSAMELPGKK